MQRKAAHPMGGTANIQHSTGGGQAAWIDVEPAQSRRCGYARLSPWIDRTAASSCVHHLVCSRFEEWFGNWRIVVVTAINPILAFITVMQSAE